MGLIVVGQRRPKAVRNSVSVTGPSETIPRTFWSAESQHHRPTSFHHLLARRCWRRFLTATRHRANSTEPGMSAWIVSANRRRGLVARTRRETWSE